MWIAIPQWLQTFVPSAIMVFATLIIVLQISMQTTLMQARLRAQYAAQQAAQLIGNRMYYMSLPRGATLDEAVDEVRGQMAAVLEQVPAGTVAFDKKVIDGRLYVQSTVSSAYVPLLGPVLIATAPVMESATALAMSDVPPYVVTLKQAGGVQGAIQFPVLAGGEWKNGAEGAPWPGSLKIGPNGPKGCGYGIITTTAPCMEVAVSPPGTN